MKEDIKIPEVKDVGVAIVREKNPDGERVWNSYLLNLKGHLIEGVLVTSRGHGTVNGEERETSTLRHFLEEVPSNCYKKIEPIVEDVFGFTNEYWVSFFDESKVFDKKFIFEPDYISPENYIEIPLMGIKGVLLI